MADQATIMDCRRVVRNIHFRVSAGRFFFKPSHAYPSGAHHVVTLVAAQIIEQGSFGPCRAGGCGGGDNG